MSQQYGRIVSAIEFTLDQLREGPRVQARGEREPLYRARIENYYTHKIRFVLYGIKCLKPLDMDRAQGYLRELRRLKETMQ
jgi:hypothetical protein